MPRESRRNEEDEASENAGVCEEVSAEARGDQAVIEDGAVACVLDAFFVSVRSMWVVVVDRPLALGMRLIDDEGADWKVVGQQWHQRAGGPLGYALKGPEGSRPRGKLARA